VKKKSHDTHKIRNTKQHDSCNKICIYSKAIHLIEYIVRCCIYLTTYILHDWIKSFLKITIEGRVIYGNLENKINTLYWPLENSIPRNNWPVENSICQVTAALCNLLLHSLTLTSEINKYCNR
jgi:hypothetical protein